MDRDKGSTVPKQGGIGRTNFIDQQEDGNDQQVSSDISSIDQQEGEMAHGALGGNLGSDDEVKPDAEK
ncbi:MAG TPA: hypothetical protein VHK91_16245 [Flavisolibacter sp.]|jgi:hypothetical protein|nr:hypothetical protein [Flavisolibacter sp.]